MKKIVCVSLLATVVVATGAANAGAQSDPLRAGAQRTYDVVKGYITRAAEKMPEEHYSFKPTKDVRSFGQLIGHIADASFGFCSAVARQAADGRLRRHDREEHHDKRRPAEGAGGRVRVVRQGLREDERQQGDRNDEGLRGRAAEAGRARVQHGPRLRALRQHRDLHAPERHRPAFVRAAEVGSLQQEARPRSVPEVAHRV